MRLVFKPNLNPFKRKTGIKGKISSWPIRVAVDDKVHGPELPENN